MYWKATILTFSHLDPFLLVTWMLGIKVLLVLLLLLLLFKLNVEFELPLTEPVRNKSLGGLKEGNLALGTFFADKDEKEVLDSKTFLAFDAFGSCFIVTLLKSFLLSILF